MVKLVKRVASSRSTTGSGQSVWCNTLSTGSVNYVQVVATKLDSQAHCTVSCRLVIALYLATSEASVSTSKGILSSMGEMMVSAIIFFTPSNASLVSWDNGKDLQLVTGFIRSEKFGTHCE